MMKEKFLVLFLMMLLTISCNTPSNFFNRPKVTPTINGNCSGFRNGEMIDATNYISVSPDEYELLNEYFDKREYCNYICIKYPKRCKGCN